LYIVKEKKNPRGQKERTGCKSPVAPLEGKRGVEKGKGREVEPGWKSKITTQVTPGRKKRGKKESGKRKASVQSTEADSGNRMEKDSGGTGGKKKKVRRTNKS